MALPNRERYFRIFRKNHDPVGRGWLQRSAVARHSPEDVRPAGRSTASGSVALSGVITFLRADHPDPLAGIQPLHPRALLAIDLIVAGASWIGLGLGLRR